MKDPDDIDMRSWQGSDPVPKEYFSALYEDEDPVEVFGDKIGSLYCNWQSRNSFEFNRMPVSKDEVIEAVRKYLSE